MITPELEALGKTLKQQFVMHLNHGGRGHSYAYHIIDASGRKVGSKSVWRGKKNGKDRDIVGYTMGDAEFDTAESFLLAYRQKIRDEEFDAAAPNEKMT